MRTRRKPEDISLKHTPNKHPWRLPVSLLLLALLIAITPLSAVTLLFETAERGKIQGFSILSAGSPSTPSGYHNSNEYYKTDGYVGRLVYEGPSTTFLFLNNGYNASGGSLTNFYFIRANNNKDWREIFYVLRIKGLTHGGSPDDFSGINKTIVTTGSTYELPHGAGSETVPEGEQGFNLGGNAGTNTNNSHPYKYKYRYIWIDLIIVNSSNKSWGGLFDPLPTGGYYENNLLITSTSGAAIELNLSAQYWPGLFETQPFTYTFAVEKEYLAPIPYPDLEWRNDITTSIKVATVRYISDVHKANVTFSSNVAGTNQTFSFVDTQGRVINYYLAYEPTIGNGPFAQITTANKTYTTKSTTENSPIDSKTYKANRLEGNLRVYLPSVTNPPMPGIYSSNIYVLVTKTN